MTGKPHKIAVITGDLVNSTALGRAKVERAFAALEDCAETQAVWHGAPLHFTRHRGDGWQVVLARPEMALRSALAFRAALRAEGSEFDSYMGIAEGDVDGDVGPDLNAETSEVFEMSGDSLGVAKEDAPARLAHFASATNDAIAILLDHISRDWTPVQAMTILPFLTPNKKTSFTDVAEAFGKSRQAITKSLDASGMVPLTTALRYYEGDRS